jgi:hypothetical protein
VFSGANAPRQPDTAIYVNVLEHIEDDEQELRALHSILPASGRLLVFVPANRWLMGTMDHQLRHYRRYTLDELTTKCRSAARTSSPSISMRLVSFQVAEILPVQIDHMEPKVIVRCSSFHPRRLERVTPPIGKRDPGC